MESDNEDQDGHIYSIANLCFIMLYRCIHKVWDHKRLDNFQIVILYNQINKKLRHGTVAPPDYCQTFKIYNNVVHLAILNKNKSKMFTTPVWRLPGVAAHVVVQVLLARERFMASGAGVRLVLR